MSNLSKPHSFYDNNSIKIDRLMRCIQVCLPLLPRLFKIISSFKFQECVRKGKRKEYQQIIYKLFSDNMNAAKKITVLLSISLFTPKLLRHTKGQALWENAKNWKVTIPTTIIKDEDLQNTTCNLIFLKCFHFHFDTTFTFEWSNTKYIVGNYL